MDTRSVAHPLDVELPSGLVLSYAEQGPASGSAVVLLHGPTDSWRSYEPVLRRLPPWLHVVAVSQRGHGDSDKPDGAFDVRVLAADVVELMGALGLDRGVLVGHSASCLVARRVAIDHPARVAGLFLEASPFSLAADPALVDFVGSVVAGLEDPISPEFVRSFVTATSSDALAPSLVDTLVDEARKVPARVWRDVFGGLLAYDDTTELARVRAPTMLVWGDGDALVSRAAQVELTERIPDARLLVYSGAGHTPRWEQPWRFAEDMAAFVASVP